MMNQDYVDWLVNVANGFLAGILTEAEFQEFFHYFGEVEFHPTWNCDEDCCPDSVCDCGDCDSCHGNENEGDDV